MRGYKREGGGRGWWRKVRFTRAKKNKNQKAKKNLNERSGEDFRKTDLDKIDNFITFQSVRKKKNRKPLRQHSSFPT